jgi:glycerol uptake facilitator-like aquaporin
MILRQGFAELLGTAGLLAAVVGSGVMGEQLASGNAAIALLANTLATVFALYVLIELFAPLSGAHFNPLVSLVIAIKGELSPTQLGIFVVAQLLGAGLGVWLVHLMFDLPVVQFSEKARTGLGQWVAEIVATAGLLFVVLRAPKDKASILVAAYIGAAYWLTASTSFANPAAVFGRMLSNTFAGIAPADAPGFVAAQFVGAALAYGLDRLFEPSK